MTLQQAVLDFLVETGREVTTDEVRAHLESRGIEAGEGSIPAALSHLRLDRERSGVIRPRKGVYVYAPDRLGDDAGEGDNNKARNLRDEIVKALKAHKGAPVATTVLAEELHPTFTGKQINQSILQASKDPARSGVERISVGVYRYNPNGKAATPKASSNGELAPLIDGIDGDLFSKIGMTLVARSKDGDFVTTDEQGTAWLVNIAVSARLL